MKSKRRVLGFMLAAVFICSSLYPVSAENSSQQDVESNVSVGAQHDETSEDVSTSNNENDDIVAEVESDVEVEIESETEESESEQTVPEETESEQTESEQTESEQTESEQTESEQTESEEAEAGEHEPGLDIPNVPEDAIAFAANFAELKHLVEKRLDILYIRLTGDIQFPNNGGINVPANRFSFTIDAMDPTTKERHTLTEGKGARQTPAISVGNAIIPNFKLEVRNANIKGQSNYGTVMVSDHIVGATVKYSNVEYEGPQMIYNINGTLYLENTVVNMTKMNYVSESQEIGEVNKLQFSGTTTINFKRTNEFSLFAFSGKDPSITLLKDATVDINTNRQLASTLQVEGAKNPDYIAEPGSTMNYAIDGLTGYSLINLNKVNMTDSVFNVTYHQYNKNELMVFHHDVLLDNSTINIEYRGTDSTDDPVSQRIIQRDSANKTFVLKNKSLFKYNSHIANPENVVDLANVLLENSTMEINTKTPYQFVNYGTLRVQSIQVIGSLLQINSDVSYDILRVRTKNGFVMDQKAEVDVNVGQVLKSNNLFTLNSDLVVGPKSIFTVHIGFATDSLKNAFSLDSFSIEEGSIFEFVVEKGEITNFFTTPRKSEVHEFNIKLPRKFVLHVNNKYKKFVDTGVQYNFKFEGSQINFWKETAVEYDEAGLLKDVPTAAYRRRDPKIDVWISGVRTNDYGSMESNMLPDEGPVPGITFDYSSEAVGFSVGAFGYGLIPIVGRDKQIAGNAPAHTQVVIDYIPRFQTEKVQVIGYADEKGEFDIEIQPIEERSEYKVRFFDKFLSETYEYVADEWVGKLEFKEFNHLMEFGISKIPSQKSVINRADKAWGHTIKDDRLDVAQWVLKVNVLKDLTPLKANNEVDPDRIVLKDSFAFVDAKGRKTPLEVGTTHEVAHSTGDEIETIAWENNQGVLINVAPLEIRTNVKYSGKVSWILEDAP